MGEHRRLLRSASLITAITLLSRVFGYLRDQRIAFLLGAGFESDAYTIAYRIPNLLRRLVGEGAASAAFIPIFTEYISDEKRKEAWEFTNSMITIVTMVMTAVTLLGILAAPLIVRAIAYGFIGTPGKVELTVLLTRIMFPYIFLISLSALAMGVLNSLHKFAAPAFAPVLLNVAVIAFSFITDLFPSPEIALAVGIVTGGVLQLMVQIPQVVRSGWSFRPRLDFRHPGVRRAARLMAPVTVGVGVAQINFVVGSLFASFLGDGSYTALYYSERVMELVLGGYAIAIATVILPTMSRFAAEGRIEDVRSTLNLATRMILFITVPATVGLIVLRVPIVEVLFQHGQFDATDTAMTAFALLFGALGLSAFAMVKIVVPGFYSLKDTKTPVKVAFGAMFLNIVFNFAFFFFTPLHVGGPALAASLAGVFNAVTLIAIFSRRQGALAIGAIVSSLVRFLVAAVPLAFAASILIEWPGFYFGEPLGQRIFALGATIALSAGVYFGAAYLIGCREPQEIRDVFRRRSR